MLLASRAVGDVAGSLFPEEAALVAKAVDKRRREFASGRVLARGLLAALGCPDAPLLRGEDRVPRWPAGVVGSISHTATRAVVAVAHVDDGVRALGVDVEEDVPLDEELRASVLTDRERARLDATPEPERGALAKLVFSAKEAVYKAQYGLSATLLDFHDVEVALLPDVAAFEARLPERVHEVVGRPTLAGTWWREASCVVTAVVVREA